MAKFQCEQCKAIVSEEDILQEKTIDKVEFWGQMVNMPYNILICPVCSEIDTFDLNCPVPENIVDKRKECASPLL